MVKVKNIKYSDVPFESKDKNFLKCVEYIKSVSPDYKKYLPKQDKQRVSFELTDANSDLANTIRRFLLDEIPVLSMHLDEKNIVSDDTFILTDYLKKNIEMIPILQDVYDIKIHLDIENHTDEIISVYSRDITISDTKGKSLDSDKYFSGTIPIINLRPAKSLKISNIQIVSGMGKNDSGKFIFLSNINYEILDIEPVTETKHETKGVSSLDSNPKHFKITCTTHRNIDPKKIMKICCDKITERLTQLLNELEMINNETTVHFSELLNVETKGDVKLFHLIGEYWTISNVISRYCYLLNSEIQFVCSSIVHPSIEESIVKITHPQAVKIMKDSVKKIITDVSLVKKAF